MIFEIRNYYYEPSLMTEYRAWAADAAVPYIESKVDLVGFWVNADEPIQISGQPQDALGTATVTWIIRWPDVATRHSAMADIFKTDEWAEIMKGNPGTEHYHRTEVKFADSLAGT